MKYFFSLFLLAILPFSAMSEALVCINNTMPTGKAKTCLNGKDCKRFKQGVVTYTIKKQQDKLSVYFKTEGSWFKEFKTFKGKNLMNHDAIVIVAKWSCGFWNPEYCRWVPAELSRVKNGC